MRVPDRSFARVKNHFVLLARLRKKSFVLLACVKIFDRNVIFYANLC